MAEKSSAQNEKSVNRVIPEGASNCIWVDAGIVSYKLCDRDFECEDCPFDQIMRQQSHHVSQVSLQSNGKMDKKQNLSDLAAPAGLVKEFLITAVSTALPVDRFYSRNHMWVKKTDGSYRIGLDKYIVSLFHDTWSVILPQLGTTSRHNSPLAWIILEDGTLVVRSFLDGKVSKINLTLKESPSLINSDPYESGWICEIAGSDNKDIESICLNAASAKAYFDDQFSELEGKLASELENKADQVGMTMADGGMRPKSLRDVIGSKKYVSVLKRLLSSGA